MPKYRFLVLGILTVVLLVGGLVVFSKSPRHTGEVVTGEETKAELSYNCEQGKTAYDLLHAHAKVDYTESSLGPLVTGINNRYQGDGRYWLYSIDGKEATIGASLYICNGGEQIKWELK